MSGPTSRRGFLRGLTTLPLIGGSVSLIGAPTAVAAPVTDALLDAYSEWLFVERRLLCLERWPDNPRAERSVPVNTGVRPFHFPNDVDWRQVPQPSTRAALVLGAVGATYWPDPPGKPPGLRKFVIE